MSAELRIAACDVGSNAVRLVVAQVLGDHPCVLQREAYYRVPLRLGEEVFAHGRVSAEKEEHLVESFLAFVHLLNVSRPVRLRACATSALRDAQNGLEVTERIRQRTGLVVEILTGAEEARTLLANAARACLSPDGRYLYVDVGGGSTELTLLAQGQVVRSASFRIGSVRLLGNRVEASEWSRLREWLEEMPASLRPTEAVGSGGNLSKLFDLLDGKASRPIERQSVEALLAKLEPLTVEERIRRFALKPDRADVIVPAARIYVQLLKWAGLEAIGVPKLGLVDGLLSQMYEELLGYAPPV